MTAVFVAATVGCFALVAVLAYALHRFDERERRRQRERMYAGRRPSGFFDAEADARIGYFARTAPDDEIRAAVRLWESAELDRAAARVVAEMAEQAAEESVRRQAAAAEEEGAA